jgi:hypothetical protein
MLGKDDLKAIVDTISPLIDARAKTTEILLKGAVTEAKEEIKSSMATKQDVEAAVEAAKSELKADIYTLNATLVKKVQSHERRITNIEQKEDIPNPDKN